MWRTLLGIDPQTRAEKRASINGINLFFGALIGANLGSLEHLGLRDYALLISIGLRDRALHPALARRSESLGERRHARGHDRRFVCPLLTPLGIAFFENRPRPSPHLFVTICLWLGTVALVEFRPLARNEPPRKEEA